MQDWFLQFFRRGTVFLKANDSLKDVASLAQRTLLQQKYPIATNTSHQTGLLAPHCPPRREFGITSNLPTYINTLQ